jgi:hypothetical protein
MPARTQPLHLLAKSSAITLTRKQGVTDAKKDLVRNILPIIVPKLCDASS